MYSLWHLEITISPPCIIHRAPGRPQNVPGPTYRFLNQPRSLLASANTWTKSHQITLGLASAGRPVCIYALSQYFLCFSAKLAAAPLNQHQRPASRPPLSLLKTSESLALVPCANCSLMKAALERLSAEASAFTDPRGCCHPHNDYVRANWVLLGLGNRVDHTGL